MHVRSVMDRKTARIRLGAPLSQAAEILVLTQASDLMVTAPDGTFAGVMSEGDLLAALMPDFEGLLDSGATLNQAVAAFLDAGAEYADQPIDRFIVRRTINLRPDDELLKAATVMVTKGIRRLPVVEGGRFTGSVSRADICWALLADQGARA